MNAFLNLFKGFEMWLAKNGRRKWKRKEKWRSMYRGREKGFLGQLIAGVEMCLSRKGLCSFA